MTPKAQKLLEILEKVSLPEVKKQAFFDRLETEGATRAIVEAMKQAIRSEQAKKLLRLPSILENKDPEIKMANRKLAQELRQAKEIFLREIGQIEKEAEMLKNDIAGDLARLTEIIATPPTPAIEPPPEPESSAPPAE